VFNPAFAVSRARALWTAISEDPTYLAGLDPVFESVRRLQSRTMTAAGRLAAILAVDVVDYLAPDGRGANALVNPTALTPPAPVIDADQGVRRRGAFGPHSCTNLDKRSAELLARMAASG
jgi:hypothetical protein